MQILGKLDFLKLTFPADFLARYQNGITFKKSWTIRFNANEVVFFGARNLSIEHLTTAQIEATKSLILGARLEELVEYLTAPEVAEMISYLDLQDLIRPVYHNEFVGTAWEKQVEFFADFVDDPNAAQRRLMQTSVCVVGVGGTGNTSIQQLVCAGIQKFILIDDDIVERGNFNRQFCFESEDIGRSKVAAMKDYILARNPDARVDIFCERIDSSADLDRLLSGEFKPDVIVGCADTPPIAIQTFILEYCIKHDVICTFGGLAVHHGLVGPILTEKSHQERYLAHRLQQMQLISHLTAAQSGTGIPTGSICYLATTIASLVIGDLIDLLSGIKQPPSLNTAWRYDPYSKSIVREQQY
jgi:molybdopterin/thiamine biosynthesis adenylyltransferase